MFCFVVFECLHQLWTWTGPVLSLRSCWRMRRTQKMWRSSSPRVEHWDPAGWRCKPRTVLLLLNVHDLYRDDRQILNASPGLVSPELNEALASSCDWISRFSSGSGEPPEPKIYRVWKRFIKPSDPQQNRLNEAASCLHYWTFLHL